MDFTYLADSDHKCKKDILIGRIKNVEDKSWKKIRPRPTKTNYEGPYYICKGMYVIFTLVLNFFCGVHFVAVHGNRTFEQVLNRNCLKL